MKVKLISHTPEPEKLIAAAAKLCYSPVGVEEIAANLDGVKVDKFVNMLADIGHESPFEHISFSFAIEGISRVLTHQLVRHRIGCSYSQQSQRYVKLDQFEYVMPPAIAEDEIAKGIFIEAMKDDQRAYDGLVYRLMANGKTEKQAIEDARYVFPNACETKIVVTMTARALFNFFSHRCCNRAQWEIRGLAEEMLRLVKEVAPIAFKHCGPDCLCGPCPEGKMSCGEIAAVRKKYKGDKDE